MRAVSIRVVPVALVTCVLLVACGTLTPAGSGQASSAASQSAAASSAAAASSQAAAAAQLAQAEANSCAAIGGEVVGELCHSDLPFNDGGRCALAAVTFDYGSISQPQLQYEQQLYPGCFT